MEELNPLEREFCKLTLNYAYYHVVFCTLQALVLWFGGRKKHFAVAHAFGLFAFVMDYTLSYMTTGTRTLEMADNSGESLGAVGAFLFFLWFDYAGFGLILWALDVEEAVRTTFRSGLRASVVQIMTQPLLLFNLLSMPFLFWSAPYFSSYVGFDDRTLILTRASSKLTYLAMGAAFLLFLRIGSKLTWICDILPIFISGFGVGCCHHLALFVFGMRGYSDLTSLVVTLCTEWPALMLGLGSFSRLDSRLVKVDSWPIVPKGQDGLSVFTLCMWALMGVLMYPHLAAMDDKHAMLYLMPYIPGQYMQSLGTAYLQTRTCIIPHRVPAYILNATMSSRLNCWADDAGDGRQLMGNDGGDMLVLASAAKGGAVLSALLAAEIGSACGLCVASGERSSPGIPGPVEELPVYDGQLLHAIVNMRTWPDYVKGRMGYHMYSVAPEQHLSVMPFGDTATVTAATDQGDDGGRGLASSRTASVQNNTGMVGPKVRCVTLLRDPLSRLRSLYTYARSGGEHWFRFESGLMQALSNSSITLQDSLDLFWQQLGQAYLVQSHKYLMMNLVLGCAPIHMESFKNNFIDTLRQVLTVYGINEAAQGPLVERISSSADVGRQTEQQRRADSHLTANKFDPALVREMDHRLMDMSPVRNMVTTQRKELAAYVFYTYNTNKM